MMRSRLLIPFAFVLTVLLWVPSGSFAQTTPKKATTTGEVRGNEDCAT
jgi:hypothetical protein